MKTDYLQGLLFVLTSLCELVTLVPEPRPVAVVVVVVVVVVVTWVVMTAE